MNYNQFIENITLELKKTLPGKQSQILMAPSFRSDIPASSNYIRAGVMLLLYPIQSKIFTVFMKRVAYPGIHSAQISFPGGKYDETDQTLLDTALRETHEEFGIPAKEIKVLGALTPLHIPVSGFEIFPFVGSLPNKPNFSIDKSEVDYLIEVDLVELFKKENRKTETQKHRNFTGEVPFYFVKGEKIWGATAMVLCEFQTIIENHLKL